PEESDEEREYAEAHGRERQEPRDQGDMFGRVTVERVQIDRVEVGDPCRELGGVEDQPSDQDQDDRDGRQRSPGDREQRVGPSPHGPSIPASRGGGCNGNVAAYPDGSSRRLHGWSAGHREKSSLKES